MYFDLQYIYQYFHDCQLENLVFLKPPFSYDPQYFKFAVMEIKDLLQMECEMAQTHFVFYF
jgi:hypothetical protein